MKKIIIIVVGIVMVINFIALAPAVNAATLQPDSLIKAEGSKTVYYYAADGKRYAFPNQKIYESWFVNFDGIVSVTDEELSSIPYGGVVHYRPGILLIKIPTDPKVYSVGTNGTLHWITTEAIAKALYGDDWSNLVDDLPVAFFASYHLGNNISNTSQFDPEQETEDSPTISHDMGLHLGWINRGADTEKCRAVPAHKVGQKGPATPAISARDCARAKHETEDQEGGFSLSSVVATAATSTAAITWLTNQDSTSKVTYNTQDLSATSTNQTVSDSSMVKTHSISLSGLTPNTLYYYQVESTNNSSQTIKASQKTFTTGLIVDTTAPQISSVNAAVGAHSAVVSWITNEISDSIIRYATSSLGSATSILTATNTAMVLSHSVTLTDLLPETQYFYQVSSKDSSGNTATSTEVTFTTIVDVTVPVISGIAATPTSTAVTIAWSTDELASSFLKYAESDLSTATTTWSLDNGNLVTSHSFDANGLTASTTYYFFVSSTDAFGNTSTSTQQTFLTE